MLRISTLSPTLSFLDRLAVGLWDQAGRNPLRLAEALLLLPTRRACLAMREAFLRHMDTSAALLPRMAPLGDLDEAEMGFAAPLMATIPPPLSPLRRHMLLTRLVQKRDSTMPLDQAALLAESLAMLLDQAHIEGRDLRELSTLVEEKELATHWQETLRFLSILTETWPQVLAAEGGLDPADHRARLIAAQAAVWQNAPPSFPVIAAGSTGSMPVTADLLHVIAGLPQGHVVLPGLDRELDEDAWQKIDETHPQYGMKQWLEKAGVDRRDVPDWLPDVAPRAARRALLRETLRPADATEAWQTLRSDAVPVEAREGLIRLDLDHLQEEAQTIALIMRETLETPDKTAALITPDRALAERVSVLLARWGLTVNDTAGAPLTTHPAGSFLCGLLAVASPDATDVAWASLLKHPLAAAHLSVGECRRRVRRVERKMWRDTREAPPESREWLHDVQKLVSPLSDTWNMAASVSAWIDRLVRVAEKMATTDTQNGRERLWGSEAGEVAAVWLDEWRNAVVDMPPLTGRDFADLFEVLLRKVMVRPVKGVHPRLHILGPLEARLLHVDRVILGGLNEGVWPPEVPPDPWLSRPMKKRFGLPLPERRIGLAAHDFAQLAALPEVFLTRARRAGNAPTVPSRFLLQLEAVLGALGYPKTVLDPVVPWPLWARRLDAPAAIIPCLPPEPRPPLADRPTQLPVTDIGLWQRNPYALYAKRILRLRKLEAMDAPLDASDRGNFIHKALEIFAITYPQDLPANAAEELGRMGRDVFAAHAHHPEVKAFWWPRFERIAAWFLMTEEKRRAEGTFVEKAEAEGRLMFNAFTLIGRADRIDRHNDGSLSILDYKTGSMPSVKYVERGIEPQLSLLALIAEKGGFQGIAASSVRDAAYWGLGTERSDGKIQVFKGISALSADAQEGLLSLVASYADPTMPYRAIPRPYLSPQYDDYVHLARLAEWGRTHKEEA